MQPRTSLSKFAQNWPKVRMNVRKNIGPHRRWVNHSESVLYRVLGIDCERDRDVGVRVRIECREAVRILDARGIRIDNRWQRASL